MNDLPKTFWTRTTSWLGVLSPWRRILLCIVVGVTVALGYALVATRWLMTRDEPPGCMVTP